MSAPSQLFAHFFAKLDAGLALYDDVVATRLYNALTPASKMMFVIVVLTFGYRVMFGSVQEPLREGVLRIARTAVIIGLVQIGNYHAFIADFFLTAPDQFAAIITGESPESRVHFLDSLWDQQWDFGDAFWQKGSAAGMKGIGLQIVALFLWAIALATTGGSALALMVAKAGLHVWLSVGPVFVLLAMYEATKQYTNSWLGQTVTFGLLPMLVGAIIYLILSLGHSYMLEIDAIGAKADPALNQTIPFILVCVGAGIFLKQIPSFASGLGGGVAISTLNAMGAASRALGGGLGSAKDLMTGKTLADMRGARRHKARNAEWAKENPGMTAKAYRKLTSLRKNKVTKA